MIECLSLFVIEPIIDDLRLFIDSDINNILAVIVMERLVEKSRKKKEVTEL